MTSWNADTLRRLIADRQPGHALERAFYGSDEVFQADLALIFGRHWINVGVEPDVPEPGDAVTVEVGSWSIIIVRDDDMQIRAFHNVCRHRGARIMRQRRAMVGNLVCSYHTWTYGLDGRLLFANHMDDDFDTSCHGLRKVALRSVAGLLFICLADDPPADIDDLQAAMTPYLAPHDIASTRIAHEVDLIERGNWKLTMENNRECYHCAGNHPELTVPLFAYGFGFSPERLDEASRHEAERYAALVQSSHTEWEARGLPSREIEHLEDRISGFRTERLPIDQHGESQTIDTRSACRLLLGTLDQRRLGGLSFWTQPNSWHHFMSDHIVTFSALPLDATTTLVRTRWLVHKDAIEGVDYDLANLTGVWNATNAQDAALVEMAQEGINSPAYTPGPYSPFTEGLVNKFCRWYLDRLSAGLAA